MVHESRLARRAGTPIRARRPARAGLRRDAPVGSPMCARILRTPKRSVRNAISSHGAPRTSRTACPSSDPGVRRAHEVPVASNRIRHGGRLRPRGAAFHRAEPRVRPGHLLPEDPAVQPTVERHADEASFAVHGSREHTLVPRDRAVGRLEKSRARTDDVTARAREGDVVDVQLRGIGQRTLTRLSPAGGGDSDESECCSGAQDACEEIHGEARDSVVTQSLRFVESRSFIRRSSATSGYVLREAVAPRRA